MRLSQAISWVLGCACGVFAFVLPAPWLRAQPPLEIVILPGADAGVRVRGITPEDRARVKEAIDAGIVFLRRSQFLTGSWSTGAKKQTGAGSDGRSWALGFAALPGLALLESGVPVDDPAVQRAANFVRLGIVQQSRTYELALAVLFLDRLGDRRDGPRIRSLALRLAAGQRPLGGWGYNCPILSPAQEIVLLNALSQRKAASKPSSGKPARIDPRANDGSDNSNTQFALLALWVACRHDLPLDSCLAGVERLYRATQREGGWSYRTAYAPYGSMTCVGLLGLAAGRAIASPTKDREKDKAMAAGLRALGVYMNDPSDTQGMIASGMDKFAMGPKGAPNLYFLWSVERVGVLCGLETIGGRDWYRWGMEALLPVQRKDGSWLGRGNYGMPVIDTSMALLFLCRSDLFPDVRKTLLKRVKITDPGPIARPAAKGQQPGKEPDLPKGVEAKNSGSAGSPGAKGKLGEPVALPVGTVKVGRATTVTIRLRGPSAFRITAVRGTDEQLQVEAGSRIRQVHELEISLRPERTGAFTRTLVLRTDLPGRSEVTVVVRARAAP